MLEEPVAVKQAVSFVASLMVVAAKTAPKAKGIDNIVCKVVTDRGVIEELAKEMERLAPEYGSFFSRDAQSIRNADAIVLIGARKASFGLKGEAMGVDMDVAMSLVNLGIAVGSAVKIAEMLNVDNRVMYSVGMAAKKLGVIDADFVLGIPLAVRGKNPFFDRKRQ